MQIAVGLTFPGKLQDEGILCYMCKNFNLTLNIIEASFSMSKGWAILTFDGEEAEVRRAFDYLTSKGIHIQNIETKQ